MAQTHFERDTSQDRRNYGTMDERCTCGATFGAHYNGRCPCSECGMVHYGKCNEDDFTGKKFTERNLTAL